MSAMADGGPPTPRLGEGIFTGNRAIQPLIDPGNGAIVDASDAACAFFERPRDELVGARLAEFDLAGEEGIREAIGAAMAGDAYHSARRVRLPSGVIREMEAFGGPITIGGRRLIYTIVHDVSLQRSYEAALRRQTAVFEAAMDGMAFLDEEGRFLTLNPAFARIYGFDSPGELAGKLWSHLHDEAEGERLAAVVRPALAASGSWRGRATGRRRDGSRFDQELSLNVLHDGGLACVVRDISEPLRAERLQRALLQVAETTHRAEDTEELYPALHAIVAELMYARNFYIALWHPETGEVSYQYWVDEHDPRPEREPLGQGLTAQVLRTGETLLVDPEVLSGLVGQGLIELRGSISVDWLGVPLRSGGRTYGALVVQSYGEDQRYSSEDRDLLTFVSQQIAVAIERKRAEEEIRRLAFHDPLTGLPNRRLFRDRLEVALARARRHGGRVGVLHFDVDRFKTINDSMGHAIGDQMLRAVATRVAEGLRGSDAVARLGGDDFAVLVDDTADAAGIRQVGERLMSALRQPFVVDGRELWTTVSMGISVFPDDGATAERLLEQADVAMYRAKEKGSDAIEFFTPVLRERASENLALESSLRVALAAGDLDLHFQPIVDCLSGRVRVCEALVRWQRAGELVPPEKFIPLAEVTGLIVPLGSWVLRRACEQARVWQQAGFVNLTVSVNLSTRQLQHADLVDEVTRILAETGLAPGALELEMTESHALLSAELTTRVLARLRALGVRLAIDDFGSGYASLSYLRRLPVHAVKLDRAFVHGIPFDADNTAIASGVIEMAHALGLEVVAEGVETQEQRDSLVRWGCDRLQGFLVSPALPAAELDAWLRRNGGRVGFWTAS